MNVRSLIADLREFQRNMNFFADEGLPEHIVLRVMEHLDNSSLIAFSQCNKRLKELLDSKKFASRFALELKFTKEEETTVEVIEAMNQRIASSGRKYEVLTVNDFTDTNNEDIRSAAFDLIGMLGETVKEVTIHERYVDWFNAADFAQMLSHFRNITKYTLRNIEQNDSAGPFILDLHFHDRDFDFMENVKELELHSCFDYILNAFKSCSNLKRFTMTDYNTWRSAGVLNGFLLGQTQLEHLEIAVANPRVYEDFDGPIYLQDWHTFNFKLKSLDLYRTKANLYHLHRALGFFDQQEKLESLGVFIEYNGFGDDDENSEDDDDEDGEREWLRNLIESIWNLPELKELKMNLYSRGEQSILPETFFDELPHNNTIESVTLRCATGNFVRLLNFLDAVKEIESDCYDSHLDLSDLQLDVIAKVVKFNEDHLTYAPYEVPDNSDEFEKIFGELLMKSKDDGLKKICIGHPSWLRHQDEFQLSIGFCKNLVQSTSNLKELKLYNVRDAHEELVAYLAANKPEALEVIELHATDPSSKRIKLDN